MWGYKDTHSPSPFGGGLIAEVRGYDDALDRLMKREKASQDWVDKQVRMETEDEA